MKLLAAVTWIMSMAKTTEAFECSPKNLKNLNTKKCFPEIRAQFNWEAQRIPTESSTCLPHEFYFLFDSSKTVRRSCEEELHPWDKTSKCLEDVQLNYIDNFVNFVQLEDFDQLNTIFYATESKLVSTNQNEQNFTDIVEDFLLFEYNSDFFVGTNKQWSKASVAVDMVAQHMIRADKTLARRLQTSSVKPVVILMSDGRIERRQGGIAAEMRATKQAVMMLKADFPETHVHCVLMKLEGDKSKSFWENEKICDSKDLVFEARLDELDRTPEAIRFEEKLAYLHQRNMLCANPEMFESYVPSASPTESPTTSSPTTSPTPFPTSSPTTPEPTTSPTKIPTLSPSSTPTTSPSQAPTTPNPSISPTTSPTGEPTSTPTNSPTGAPTTASPTVSPTTTPTSSPSMEPSPSPSTSPTESPTNAPIVAPTQYPTTPTTAAPTQTPTCLFVQEIGTFKHSKIVTDNLCGMNSFTGDFVADPVLRYAGVFETAPQIDVVISCTPDTRVQYLQDSFLNGVFQLSPVDTNTGDLVFDLIASPNLGLTISLVETGTLIPADLTAIYIGAFDIDADRDERFVQENVTFCSETDTFFKGSALTHEEVNGCNSYFSVDGVDVDAPEFPNLVDISYAQRSRSILAKHDRLSAGTVYVNNLVEGVEFETGTMTRTYLSLNIDTDRCLSQE